MFKPKTIAAAAKSNAALRNRVLSVRRAIVTSITGELRRGDLPPRSAHTVLDFSVCREGGSMILFPGRAVTECRYRTPGPLHRLWQ